MDMPLDTDLESFRYTVKLFIKINSTALISNKNSEHAKVILEELFNDAKKTAYVYCGRISNEVWGGEAVAKAVKGAIDREVDVKFIVQHANEIPKDSVVYKLLKPKDLVVSSPKLAEIKSHFAVFDSKRYRFEKDDAAKSAIVCMNNETVGGQLQKLAENLVAVAA